MLYQSGPQNDICARERVEFQVYVCSVSLHNFYLKFMSLYKGVRFTQNMPQVKHSYSTRRLSTRGLCRSPPQPFPTSPMTMDAPNKRSPQEKKLIDTLTLRIEELYESCSCPICHDILNAPVLLPCSHIFCSLCIRRHLCRISACPQPTCRSRCTTSSLTTLRNYDANLLKIRVMSRTPVPLRHQSNVACLPLPGNLSRASLVKKLTSAGLNTSGNAAELKNRYREYVLRVNAASDSVCGASKEKLANDVKRHEAALSKPQKTVNVFIEKPKNGLTVQQGDNHDDLVRKIKQRKRLHSSLTSPGDVNRDKCSDGEEKDEVDDYSSSQKTTKAMKRSRSTAGQSCGPQVKDGTAQNRQDSPNADLVTGAFIQVALGSAAMNICPENRSPRKTLESDQSTTQETPPSTSNPLNLTQEQRERIHRHKMAAMERRRQNSQKYVRRLPFTDTQEAG